MNRYDILTFADSINYGALLQAFALKHTVMNLGYRCEVINYQNKKRKYSQVNGIRKIRSIVWNTTFGRVFISKIRRKRTKIFKEDCLGLSSNAKSSYFDLVELNGETDGFIVGSDQVWNPRNNAGDMTFFLSFAEEDKKKVAYAASFGQNDISKDYLNLAEVYVRRFNSISVREKAGSEILKEHFNIVPWVVLDPVFLLKKVDWINTLNLKVNAVTNQKYILCYVMPGDHAAEAKIAEIAMKISVATGFPIITLGDKPYRNARANETLDNDCGPIEFVRYICDAEYIVTNSFHGTAFSIIMRKKFWTVLNKSNVRIGRMKYLLESFSLDNRIAYADEKTDSEALTEDVGYANSEMTLNKQIAESMEYLEMALKESN